ncbi:hypothetical protein FOVSG1_006737 [Fusarium oxysporum f. sp. vasinfectum]
MGRPELPYPHPNDQASALLQGTGGVSMFALLICLSAGIRPIITSSSDDKLAKIRSLESRVAGINYKRQSILEEVQRLTDSRGVDFVINNTGPASIPEDLNCLRQKNGTVSMVGFLDGFGAEWAGSTVMKVLLKRARIQGYGIGSKADLESLVQFLDEKKVRLDTIIDRVFPFAETMVAFEYMASGSHTGKVVIRIG